MSKSNFFKIVLLIIAIIGFTFSSVFLHAQHLFSVSYNDLSKENVTQLNTQIANMEISTLSLTKNNNRDVYPVVFSSVQNTKIIILNEQTGAHAVITPAEEALTEFQLVPFFLEELKQSVLGEASRYLVMEANLDLSVKNVTSVSSAKRNVFIPRYLYGTKENVKEALPKDRKIIHIFQERPHLHSASNDPELELYITQLEEAMSYYVYMFKLPNGVLTIYDENFNPDNDKNESRVGTDLQFTLSGSMNNSQRTATEYALDLWSEQLIGTVSVDINVSMRSMGGGTLGAAYRQRQFLDPEINTWFPSALWNQMVGYNASPSTRDIRIEMNSNINFYYELNASPTGNRHDFVTVMLHEVAHGLGFFPLCGENGAFRYTTASGYSSETEYPGAFDRQLFEGLAGPSIVTLTQTQRQALMISNNLYAGAPESNLLAANGGVRVRMYAPNPYESGSSNSHWDYSVNNFSTFMKPSIGSNWALHTFNTRKIGMFLDMGWNVPDYSNAVSVTFISEEGSGETPQQQFIPGVAKKLRASGFTRYGYTFKNWNTSPDGTGTTYAERASITISSDMTLYAQWEANTYTLTFNPDGGTVNPTSIQVTFDSPIGELPIPEKDGHNFDRWTIGATTITEETIWRYVEDFTARARWTLSIADAQRTTSLQIVPNPASHSIELRIMNYELRVDRIEFYNIFGQLVKNVPFAGQSSKDGTRQKINISDLNSGVYMVRVGNETVKLVVN